MGEGKEEGFFGSFKFFPYKVVASEVVVVGDGVRLGEGGEGGSAAMALVTLAIKFNWFKLK